jgi:hypothetical protein
LDFFRLAAPAAVLGFALALFGFSVVLGLVRLIFRCGSVGTLLLGLPADV